MRIRGRGGACVRTGKSPEASLGLLVSEWRSQPWPCGSSCFLHVSGREPPPIRSRRRSRSTSSAGCRGRERWRFSPIRSRGRMPARATGPGAVRDPARGRRHGGLSRADQALEQRQGQRAGRRPRLVCRFQRPADAGHLSRLRSHQPRPLVLVPDRRGRLPAGPARLRCGSSITSGAGRRSPRSTAASGIIPAVTWEQTRIVPHSTHRAAKRWAGRATCSAAGSTRAISTSTCPYLEATLFDLLWAYELNPRAFGDDTNIPESGNGVPDLLDEVKWELDWLLKMQDADGGFFNRVAGRSYDNGSGPPSGDTQPRFYTAKTTWATADAAASLAHAARVYARFEKAFPGYSERLARRRAAGLGVSRGSSRDGSRRRHRRRFQAGGHAGRQQRRTPIAGPASMPPPSCSRRSASRHSRRTSTAGRPTSPRPRKTACTPSKDGKQVDPLNHLALTQGLFVYATTKGASPAVTEAVQGSPGTHGRGDPPGGGRPGRSLPGLSLRGPLLLGEQLGEGALGPRAPHDHGAGAEPRAPRGLPRDHGRISPFHSRTQPAVALLSDQHGARRAPIAA